MFNINWKVRFMNKTWVVTFVAAVFVLIGAIGKPLGFEMDLTTLQENVVEIVYAIFGVLALLGIVVDPTTDGFSDGFYGLQYTSPGIIEEVEEDEDDEDENEEGEQ